MKFKTYLGEIKKGKNINQKSKKTLCTILKCSTKQETKLLNFMMIILYLCLKQNQNLKELKEQVKILTPKQMLQRLPIAPAQVKAGNN